jgi:hypothetical protein
MAIYGLGGVKNDPSKTEVYLNIIYNVGSFLNRKHIASPVQKPAD